MQISEKREFLLAIEAMAVTFRQEGTEAVYEGYWRGLRDLPLAAVNVAVNRAMRECRFMPSVAEIRERADVMTQADRAIKAWGVLRQAVDQHGCYRSVNFDDPIVNATIRTLGNWRCIDDRIANEGINWIRKEFLATYAAYCRTGISHDPCGHLIGHEEFVATRYSRPQELPPPRLIACDMPPHNPGVVPLLTDERQSQPPALIAEATRTIGLLDERRE